MISAHQALKYSLLSYMEVGNLRQKVDQVWRSLCIVETEEKADCGKRLFSTVPEQSMNAQWQGSVSIAAWTHRHLARKILFFSRTITPETYCIFRSASKSLTSHGIPLSFSVFISHTEICYFCSKLSSYCFNSLISLHVSLTRQICVLHHSYSL